ncbi:hypothetical protein I317_07530 [Kwoniella heveanensis CBS 569]|nr:hypothetical protein I317_07530 [Kwoniella heveanensis CBS 569]
MLASALITYALAFLTLTSAFPFRLKPASFARVGDKDGTTLADRHAAADSTLSNGERFARGLPPKAPVKRFEASKTRAAPPKRSTLYEPDFWLEVRNLTNAEIIGRLSYDLGNGIVILPRAHGVPVVFTLRGHLTGSYPQTIWARNQYIDTVAPIVVRDWTYPNETLGPDGRRSFVFGVGGQGEASPSGDPTNRNRADVFIIRSIPPPDLPASGVEFRYTNIDPPGEDVTTPFFIDRSDRRVLRTSWDPANAKLGLDWAHDGVTLHAVAIVENE